MGPCILSRFRRTRLGQQIQDETDIQLIIVCIDFGLLATILIQHLAQRDSHMLVRTDASRTETEFEKAVLYPVIGAIAGGWLGGTLLALDWDRPWQVS